MPISNDDRLDKDTDGDGYSDVDEKEAGSNPDDAGDAPVTLDDLPDTPVAPAPVEPTAPGVPNKEFWEQHYDREVNADGSVVITQRNEYDAPDTISEPIRVLKNRDSDGDGLSDLEEYQRRTNPNDADTDDDGRTDKEEFDDGFDPTVPTPPNATPDDRDGDGMSNEEEMLYNGGGGTDFDGFAAAGLGSDATVAPKKYYDSHTVDMDPVGKAELRQRLGVDATPQEEAELMDQLGELMTSADPNSRYRGALAVNDFDPEKVDPALVDERNAYNDKAQKDAIADAINNPTPEKVRGLLRQDALVGGLDDATRASLEGALQGLYDAAVKDALANPTPEKVVGLLRQDAMLGGGLDDATRTSLEGTLLGLGGQGSNAEGGPGSGPGAGLGMSGTGTSQVSGTSGDRSSGSGVGPGADVNGPRAFGPDDAGEAERPGAGGAASTPPQEKPPASSPMDDALDNLGKGETPSEPSPTSGGSRGDAPTTVPDSIGPLDTTPRDTSSTSSKPPKEPSTDESSLGDDEAGEFGGTSITVGRGGQSTAVVHTDQGNVAITETGMRQLAEERERDEANADNNSSNDSTDDDSTDDDTSDDDTSGGGGAVAEGGMYDPDAVTVGDYGGLTRLDNTTFTSGGGAVDGRFTNTGRPDGPTTVPTDGPVTVPGTPGDETPRDDTGAADAGFAELDPTRLPGAGITTVRPELLENGPPLDPAGLPPRGGLNAFTTEDSSGGGGVPNSNPGVESSFVVGSPALAFGSGQAMELDIGDSSFGDASFDDGFDAGLDAELEPGLQDAGMAPPGHDEGQFGPGQP